MAKKKITDLTLRSGVADTVNFPIDDGVQTWRVTAPQLESYVLREGNVKTASLEDGAVSKNKLAVGAVARQSVRSIDSTDSLTLADDLVLLSGASFTLTLPTAVGVSGKIFTIKHNGTSLTQVYTLATTSSETIGLVDDGDYKLYTNGESLRIISDGSNWIILPRVQKVAYLKDVKSSGTAGGTFNSGAWRTRDLNTIEGDTSIVSLSSNQFELKKGIYFIKSDPPGYGVNTHKAILYNITDSEISLSGGNAYGTSGALSRSPIAGVIEINSTKTFEIQHRCGFSSSGNGFGPLTGWGAVEVYTQVKITKLL